MSSNPGPSPTSEPLTRPTARAVAIGVVLTALLGLAIPYGDLKLRGTWIACCHLPIAVVVLFLILWAVVNPLVTLVARAKALTRAEIVVIYCMMLCGAGIPSFGLSEYLFPTLAGVRYYASPENRWESLFIKFIPKWLAPSDSSAIVAYFEGLRPGAHLPWGAWLAPLAAWTVLAAGMFLGFVCASVLIRRQWVEHERLIFPLVQLPVQALEAQGEALWSPFFRNRAMWIAFAIPLVIHSINGFHFFFPAVPQIPLSHSIDQYFHARPWNQMGMVIVILHFSIVGFSFLLSNELSFSLWFFFLFFGLQSVVVSMFGLELPPIPDYPTRAVPALQMLGAFLVFAGYMGYLLKGRLQDAWRSAFVRPSRALTPPFGHPSPSGRGEGGEGDVGEPLGYRTTFILAAVALVISVLWCAAAGIGPLLAVVSLILFGMVALVLTRCVSEGGLLFVQAPFRPLDIIGLFAGTGFISAPAMTGMAFIQRIFMLDLRTFLLPSLLDSYKLAGWAKLDLRRLMLPIALAIAAAVLSSYVALLVIPYRYSGVSLEPWFFLWSPQQPWKTLVARLAQPVKPNPLGMAFVAAGALVTMALFTMRTRFVWWPFHPMGFAMGPSWPMIQLWFSILIGWVAKSLLLRYGTAKTYDRAKPFFMGLVVGEFVAAAIWLAVSHFTGAVGLRFFLF
jgi:hypothetical protein